MLVQGFFTSVWLSLPVRVKCNMMDVTDDFLRYAISFAYCIMIDKYDCYAATVSCPFAYGLHSIFCHIHEYCYLLTISMLLSNMLYFFILIPLLQPPSCSLPTYSILFTSMQKLLAVICAVGFRVDQNSFRIFENCTAGSRASNYNAIL